LGIINVYPWGYRPSRKYISLAVGIYTLDVISASSALKKIYILRGDICPWVSSALKKTYILWGRGKVLHFLDVVQNLIFVSLVTKPSRKSFIAAGLQGNLNFSSSLPLAAILDGWPSRIINNFLDGFYGFLRVLDCQGYSVLW